MVGATKNAIDYFKLKINSILNIIEWVTYPVFEKKTTIHFLWWIEVQRLIACYLQSQWNKDYKKNSERFKINCVLGNNGGGKSRLLGTLSMDYDSWWMINWSFDKDNYIQILDDFFVLSSYNWKSVNEELLQKQNLNFFYEKWYDLIVSSNANKVLYSSFLNIPVDYKIEFIIDFLYLNREKDYWYKLFEFENDFEGILNIFDPIKSKDYVPSNEPEEIIDFLNICLTQYYSCWRFNKLSDRFEIPIKKDEYYYEMDQAWYNFLVQMLNDYWENFFYILVVTTWYLWIELRGKYQKNFHNQIELNEDLWEDQRVFWKKLLNDKEQIIKFDEKILEWIDLIRENNVEELSRRTYKFIKQHIFNVLYFEQSSVNTMILSLSNYYSRFDSFFKKYLYSAFHCDLIFKWIRDWSEISKSFSSLSAWEKMMLSRFTNVYQRIFENKSWWAFVNNFLILVDEPDLHLHLDWQRQYVQKLIDVFSTLPLDINLHFILATHSPFIISDLPSECIVLLENWKPLKYNWKTFGANYVDLIRNGFFFQNPQMLMGSFAESIIWDIAEKRRQEITNGTQIDKSSEIIELQIWDDFLRDNLLYFKPNKQW